MTAYAMWQRVWLLRAPSSYWTWIFVGIQLWFYWCSRTSSRCTYGWKAKKPQT